MSELVWTAWRPGKTYSKGGYSMHGNPPKFKRHVVYWGLRLDFEAAIPSEALKPLPLCGYPPTPEVLAKMELKLLCVSDVTCKVCQAEWRTNGMLKRQALAVTRHLMYEAADEPFREQLADNTVESVIAFADWLEDRGDPTAKFLRVIGMADLDWQSAVRPQFKVTQ